MGGSIADPQVEGAVDSQLESVAPFSFWHLRRTRDVPDRVVRVNQERVPCRNSPDLAWEKGPGVSFLPRDRSTSVAHPDSPSGGRRGSPSRARCVLSWSLTCLAPFTLAVAR